MNPGAASSSLERPGPQRGGSPRPHRPRLAAGLPMPAAPRRLGAGRPAPRTIGRSVPTPRHARRLSLRRPDARAKCRDRRLRPAPGHRAVAAPGTARGPATTAACASARGVNGLGVVERRGRRRAHGPPVGRVAAAGIGPPRASLTSRPTRCWPRPCGDAGEIRRSTTASEGDTPMSSIVRGPVGSTPMAARAARGGPRRRGGRVRHGHRAAGMEAPQRAIPRSRLPLTRAPSVRPASPPVTPGGAAGDS